jgi:SAM-dependent methyltransferase
MLKKNDLAKRDAWDRITYGYSYDEDYGWQKDDVEFLLSIIGSAPKNILEVCCGTGRVLVPLAKAGHNMTGIDYDIGMLGRLYGKARGFANIKYRYAEAVTSDWGIGFDVVIIAANTIQNIDRSEDYYKGPETFDYKRAQEIFISKSSKALKQGGHFYFAFDLYDDPKGFFTCAPDAEYLIDPADIDMSDADTDIFSVRSKSVSGGYSYDAETRIAQGVDRTVEIFPNGERRINDELWFKHILTLEQVHEWLRAYELEVEQEYNGYHREPIKANQYNKAVIWAKKV